MVAQHVQSFRNFQIGDHEIVKVTMTTSECFRHFAKAGPVTWCAGVVLPAIQPNFKAVQAQAIGKALWHNVGLTHDVGEMRDQE